MAINFNHFWMITMFVEIGTAETGLSVDSWEELFTGTAEHAWNEALKVSNDSDAKPINIRPATKQDLIDYLECIKFEEELKRADEILPW